MVRLWSISITLLFVFTVCGAVTQRLPDPVFAPRAIKDDFERFPLNIDTSTGPDWSSQNFSSIYSGQMVHSFLLTLKNPQKYFSFLEPMNGCPGMIKTSITALSQKCLAATNVGFFNTATGACLTNLIANKKLVENTPTQYAQFGLTSQEYIVGYIAAINDTKYDWTQLTSGVGWLVRNSQSYIEKATEIEGLKFEFVNLRAPRVSIGHNKDGHLLILETDGDESIMHGLTLLEFANLFIKVGAVNAINLDGGGSSTVFVNGTVVNKPSDWCPYIEAGRCERAVTSIACFHE